MRSATAPEWAWVRRNLGRGAACSSASRRAFSAGRARESGGPAQTGRLPGPFATLLHLLQRCVQIRDQVIGILDADGDANQRIGDSEAVAGLLGHAGMRSAGRMR